MRLISVEASNLRWKLLSAMQASLLRILEICLSIKPSD